MTRKLDQTTKKGKQMTEELKDVSTGAPFQGVTDWHAIDWKSVSRLQARIVKATQEKKWGKVKALQHLLTHSFSGKALAVRRVTENQGKNTPGVDKVTWNTPQKKINAVYELRQKDYHPQPLRRIYIPKKNGRKRLLGIPAMKCRAMQALYLLALDPVAETTADPNSYGFRPQRSTADAIEQCFIVLGNKCTGIAPNTGGRRREMWYAIKVRSILRAFPFSKEEQERKERPSSQLGLVQTKKESFSCILKKNSTTRNSLYGLFYLNATSSGYGRG